MRTTRTYPPVLANREALAQTSVLVSFGKQPRSVHEILPLEELCDLLVPKSDIALVVVDNRAQFLIRSEVFHQGVHSLEAFVQVEDEIFGRLEWDRISML